MLQQLDESLESFLRAEVPLSRDEVDVAFEAPDPDWGAGITKPTINLYLWDIRRSATQSEAGKMLRERNGEKVWVDPLPRVSFRYMVTAWANEVRDEHQLLGAIMTTLLPTVVIPEDHLKGSLRALRPQPMLAISGHDSTDFTEFWSALEGKLKPGLDLVITATIDAAMIKEAGPPTEGLELAFDDKDRGGKASGRRIVMGRVADPAGAGVVVLGPRGSAVVNADGTFAIAAHPGDELIVELPEPRRVRVPESGQVVVD